MEVEKGTLRTKNTRHVKIAIIKKSKNNLTMDVQLTSLIHSTFTSIMEVLNTFP